MFRSDGTSKIVTNIYQKNIDMDDLGKSQLKKPTRGPGKDQNNVIEASTSIIEDAAKDQDDEKLLQILNNYLIEMLQSSYCPLVEELFV